MDVGLGKLRHVVDFLFVENTDRQYNDIGCALKVADVVKWDSDDKYRWQKIHLSMPAIVTSKSVKHRVTKPLRRLLKSWKCL